MRGLLTFFEQNVNKKEVYLAGYYQIHLLASRSQALSDDGEGEIECTALINLAFSPDATAVRLDDMSGDR